MTNPARPWYRRSLVRWIRDIGIICLVIYGISQWQMRGMLSTDGDSVASVTFVKTLNGEPFTISPKTGKRTLIYFFAPWCEICKLSISNVDSVDTERFQVFRVALDYDNPNEVRKFIENTGVTGRVYLGNEQLKSNFQVQGYPSYYLLDEQFNVIDRALGYSTAAGLRVRTWLSAPGPDTPH
ncbi:TlpA family protein disulfide reductase [Salinimonas sediminis]|uniref:TlpA family protein disulfide reductase n=1 Tax=Salinimonas sediminis TaxID=2303538 RepID=A0A346NMR2_9ALTE|nr:TlpA disulfide reductase family protein [Salinimonas sediminis]AXR06819.1 TlpA family protein disulfide reductase [Salinimonas sediminis]